MVFSLLVGLLELWMAGYLARYVVGQNSGTPEMRAISDAIREGAEAFLRRQ
jgi:K(+)-stimulated pyrophosphate-energized sodium pump